MRPLLAFVLRRVAVAAIGIARRLDPHPVEYRVDAAGTGRVSIDTRPSADVLHRAHWTREVN